MLRRLVLSNTGISVLPASISAMRALSELHVSHNKLQELPAGMSALTSLERLFAADNLLVSASPLLKLSLLHTLDLSRNQLRSIGSFEWPHLVMLDLSHNDLRSLPTVIVSSSKRSNHQQRETFLGIVICSLLHRECVQISGT